MCTFHLFSFNVKCWEKPAFPFSNSLYISTIPFFSCFSFSVLWYYLGKTWYWNVQGAIYRKLFLTQYIETWNPHQTGVFKHLVQMVVLYVVYTRKTHKSQCGMESETTSTMIYIDRIEKQFKLLPKCSVVSLAYIINESSPIRTLVCIRALFLCSCHSM